MDFVIEALTSTDDDIRAPGIDFMACFFQLLYPELETRTIDEIGEVLVRCTAPAIDVPTAKVLKVRDTFY